MLIRGQSSLEYLLLIAGAVLVSVVVMLLLIQTTPTGGDFLGNQLNNYTTIGLPPSPPLITGAPQILSFNASPDSTPGTYSGSVRLDFDVNNISPSATIEIRGWNTGLSTAPASVTIANFSGLSTSDFSTTLNGIQSPRHLSFVTEVMPQASHNYLFALFTCNTTNPSDCALSTAVTLSKTGTPINPISILMNGDDNEMVWDYSLSKCNTNDIPDMPARALVNGSGELLVTRVHSYDNYILFGNDFTPANLSTSCSTPPLQSSTLPTNSVADPTTYNDREWIGALYRETGNSIIHAVVHNEYHDPRFNSSSASSGGSGNGPCNYSNTLSGNGCSYFSLTAAESYDGGHTFTQSNPTDVIAAPFLTWDPNALVTHFRPPQTNPLYIYPTHGVMMNSNIVKRGSYYYLLAHAINNADNPSSTTRGVCAGRTNNLSDPTSWRFWQVDPLTSGQGSYSLRLGSPYSNPSQAPPGGCSFVGKQEIDQLVQSVTYNTYLEKFVVAGMSQDINAAARNGYTCGFYYSTSDDLITWTNKKLLMEAGTVNGPCANTNASGALLPIQESYGVKIYPSIIDHAELSNPNDPNFELSGKSPYLYYTRYHAGLDRDLQRVPFSFCDAAKEPSGTCS